MCNKKVIACPLELLVARRKVVNTTLLAVGLCLAYEWTLSMHPTLMSTLLDDASPAIRALSGGLLMQNKEGIGSLVGYVAIYFGAEAVCLRLNSVLIG